MKKTIKFTPAKLASLKHPISKQPEKWYDLGCDGLAVFVMPPPRHLIRGLVNLTILSLSFFVQDLNLNSLIIKILFNCKNNFTFGSTFC